MRTGVCKCGNPSRYSAGYCYGCHAAYMRRWRKTHPMTAEQRVRSNARAYVHVYLRRGTLKRGLCSVCGNPNTQPHHGDYSKPLDVVWLCVKHHLQAHGKTMRKGSV